jgi:hypothetical protein
MSVLAFHKAVVFHFPTSIRGTDTERITYAAQSFSFSESTADSRPAGMLNF